MGKRKRLLNWDEGESLRQCDWAGCKEHATHRTPESPERMEAFRWLCNDHARKFNADWNFFGDMSRAEIERFQKDDVIGHRPTWPVGTGPIARAVNGQYRDHFGVFTREGIQFPGEGGPHAPRQPEPEERRALARLNLRPDSSLEEIKNRYKKLVKRIHPDLHGGDKRSEEQLKDVNEAYSYLIARAQS
jgi:DnaJ-domain-containing protein 1